jgi:DNA-binding HxlR family transcriptional regulator
MAGYGQFCAVARAQDLLGGRWTLLIVRELLCGSRRFSDIHRGVPRISRTMLSARLQTLLSIGAVTRTEGAHGPEYALTNSGRELAEIVGAFGRWGQRWLPRQAKEEDLDQEPVLLDMQRRTRLNELPSRPLVLRFELGRPGNPRFLMLRRGEASLCSQNPGFPEPLRIHGPLAALVGWWRGDVSYLQAQRVGLRVEGARHLVRAFPTWFDRYLFAEIAPARV